ncbi:MAG: ral secretion pathway protein [Hyphomicrobiales bacterium]|jgi:general secretion pathway protein M|nr:ral secretion pathway protein [Hyphomicrobiales bacterium]
MSSPSLDRYLTSHPGMATAFYALVILALLFTAWSSVADIFARRQALAASEDLLAQLEGRRASPFGGPGSPAGPVPTGSPFLEGQTVTVAGAALLQRVAEAVTRVGGNVLSSQVDLQGTKSKDGFISLIASCEVEQAALQRLLYDLESGMPFLFIEQLVAQAPQAAAASNTTRMRVLVSVAGQWRDAK